ncbi:MAG: hypothetical protein AAGA08_16940 [Pseudomonadota bacterium]
MTAPDTVTQRRGYSARELSIDEQIRVQLDSETLAEAKGMREEASRSRIRRQALEAKRSRNESGKTRRARRVSRSRDPLARMPDSLRRAGELLRDHAEGAVISMFQGEFSLDCIQGGVGRDMETVVDMRSYGSVAWSDALRAIQDPRFVRPIANVIAYRLSLRKAALSVFGTESGAGRSKAEAALTQALTQAASFFGVVERDIDERGQ